MTFQNRIRMTIFGLGLTLGAGAMAHDTVISGWCPRPNSTSVVASFSFTPQNLVAFKNAIQRQASDALMCPSVFLGLERPVHNETCGIVDDWHYAHQLALRHCASLAPNAPSAQRPMPFFTVVPATFSPTSQNHHTTYAFGDGVLRGECRICVAPIVR
jgi:hypothetical protein